VLNVLVDVSYSVQTKLIELDDQEAVKLLEQHLITGRGGLFGLKSGKNLTPKQAL